MSYYARSLASAVNPTASSDDVSFGVLSKYSIASLALFICFSWPYAISAGLDEFEQLTSSNFLALCASGYYDGTIFHRNIKGFMIQGGDPTNTGKGGTSIWGKKFNDEIRESLKHNARGILSMANSGPNTNGSQFFITYGKQPHLNGLYTIFGKVIHGFEILDIMEKAQTGPGDRPLMEIRINRITIHANPLAG
ncbi:UNVERIFIED_CONTAM: Peptidyl-prolyl cis-trans isomerase CYP18-1 [Sesamum indicum]